MKADLKKKAIRRLKIIEGQIRGLQNMVAAEEYCIDIMIQASAVKEALASVESLILENHLSTHVIDQIQSGRKAQAIQEILKVYRANKK